MIVAVGAFRHEGSADVAARDGAGGGYRLLAWSLSPLHHDLGSAEGQEALGLEPGDLDGVGIARFRARRGDDASCLNLYAPREPTVLAATPSFVRERRFSFQSSLAETDEERANPWLLLERAREPGGAIPVVADAGTLAYALHRKLGDEMPLGATGARVRFVAALAPGLLQGQLLMGERHFLEAFPGETGDRFFLFDVPGDRADAARHPARVAPLRLRLRRRRDGGAPARPPPRREHLHRDVPGPGRARPPPGQRRARDRPRAQRPRAARRARAPAGGRVRPAPPRADGARPERRPGRPRLPGGSGARAPRRRFPRSSIAAGRCRWRSWPSCSSPWPRSASSSPGWRSRSCAGCRSWPRCAPNDTRPCRMKESPMRKTAVVALVLLTASASAADWPQWRGPARDGRASLAPRRHSAGSAHPGLEGRGRGGARVPGRRRGPGLRLQPRG